MCPEVYLLCILRKCFVSIDPPALACWSCLAFLFLNVAKTNSPTNNIRKWQRGSGARDVGNFSNLGARRFESTFPLEKGYFVKLNGAPLCLLQILGALAPNAPRFLRLCGVFSVYSSQSTNYQTRYKNIVWIPLPLSTDRRLLKKYGNPIRKSKLNGLISPKATDLCVFLS